MNKATKRTLRGDVQRMETEMAALRLLVDALTLSERLASVAARVARLEAERPATRKAG